MSVFATLQITHKGIVGATIPNCQIDTRIAPEQGGFSGSEPHMRYEIYLPQTTQVFQDDLLTDTASGKSYRVISDPEFFPNGHGELHADQYRGT